MGEKKYKILWATTKEDIAEYMCLDTALILLHALYQSYSDETEGLILIPMEEDSPKESINGI